MSIGNLNILSDKKSRIETSISSLEERKSQAEGTLTVISPKSKIDVEIKQLQIDKKIVALRKESRFIDFETQLESGNISNEEYNTRVSGLDKQYQDEIKVIDDKIEVLQQQKEHSDPYKHIDRKTGKNKLKKESILSNVRKNRTKSISSIGKTAVKTATTIVALVVSKLVYKQLTSSNNRLGKLDTLVNNVNDQIDAIKTKNDIEKARNARNNALKVLNDVELALIKIKKIIDSINKVVKILSIVVTALKIASNIAPPPIKGVLMSKLSKIEAILNSVQVVLSTASRVLESLIELVRIIRDRLKQIGDLLDALIQDPTKIGSDDLTSLLDSGYGKLGMLSETYKDWRFEIKEEFDKNFVVQSNKRRYAVAINKDNTPVLKSQASFTLDPDVLVGELKLTIDEQNLKP
jgi:hypothetical protein